MKRFRVYSQRMVVDPRMGFLFLTGSSVKCIQNEDGTWLTLKEFEMEGKGRNTKNWNRSIRCGGTTLAELLKVL